MHPLQQALAQARADHQYRQRHIRDSAQGVLLQQDGREWLSFNSNDYLGLANHPTVISAATQAMTQGGVGSGAAHLISGHHRLHHELEEALADFTQRSRALLFSTGYMANFAVISSLYHKGDAIFEDRLNHASLIDAARLGEAALVRYQHLDMPSLGRQLDTHAAAQRVLVSDGIFSMDGDECDVTGMCQLAKRFDADVMIDDAHGIGVVGEHGQGTVLSQGGSEQDVPLLVGTLGKALGTFGAFVAGPDDVIETLIQTARPYIYTTALPPAIAAATLASLRLAREEDWRREQLQSHVQTFRRGLEEMGLVAATSTSPIQPLLLGDSETALRASQALQQHDILVSAIRPPTVPTGQARLRITFSAEHSEAHIRSLLDAIEQSVLPLLRDQ